MKIPNASDKGETGLKSPPKKKRLEAGEFMTPQATPFFMANHVTL